MVNGQKKHCQIDLKMLLNNKTMNIVLTFNESNNFCPVCEKHGNKSESIEIARMVSWVINNAEVSIQKAYKVGAPRRIEMEKLCNNLREQLIRQISSDEVEELKINIEPLILGK